MAPARLVACAGWACCAHRLTLSKRRLRKVVWMNCLLTVSCIRPSRVQWESIAERWPKPPLARPTSTEFLSNLDPAAWSCHYRDERRHAPPYHLQRNPETLKLRPYSFGVRMHEPQLNQL